MEFVEERKVTLPYISKSFAETYETCKLKAWKKKRTKKDEDNRFLRLGKCAHELFAQKIAQRMGQNYKISKVTDPSIMFEAEEILRKTNVNRIVEGTEIIGFEETAETMLPNGMTLIGVFDLIMLVEDEILGPYVQVFDFKTSFVVKKEIDNEAIFYAYLAAEKYGLPVTFTRYSGRTGDMWGHFFPYERAMALAPLIVPYAEEIRDVIESPEEPFPEAGPHCDGCPFFDTCYAKEYDLDDVRQLVTFHQLAKVQVKRTGEKIKNFRLENQTAIETEEFVIDMKETRSNAIATKGVTKKDLLLLFAKSGKLDQILESLDMKITDEVIQKAEDFGLSFKEKVTRSLSIEAKGETDEETTGGDDE